MLSLIVSSPLRTLLMVSTEDGLGVGRSLPPSFRTPSCRPISRVSDKKVEST